MAFNRDKYRIEYSYDGENDLYDIFEYITYRLESPENARSQIRRIVNKINSLTDTPNRYKAFNKGKWQLVNAHEFIVDNYRVIYTVNDERKLVLIMRVAYTGKNTGNL